MMVKRLIILGLLSLPFIVNAQCYETGGAISGGGTYPACGDVTVTINSTLTPAASGYEVMWVYYFVSNDLPGASVLVNDNVVSKTFTFTTAEIAGKDAVYIRRCIRPTGTNCDWAETNSEIVSFDCCAPSATISGPFSLVKNQNGSFSASSTDPGVTYVWNFGADAIPPTITGPGPHSVYWTNGGNKSINLEVDNGSGCAGLAFTSVSVANCSYGGSISGAASACTTGGTATESFEAIGFPAGATLNWTFGSGASPATATGAGPHSITYNSVGIKSIVLTASNGGETCTFAKNFRVSDCVACTPFPDQTITIPSETDCFENAGGWSELRDFSISPGVAGATYDWDFSSAGGFDPINAGGQNISQYLGQGPYTVYCTINSGGCTETFTTTYNGVGGFCIFGDDPNSGQCANSLTSFRSTIYLDFESNAPYTIDFDVNGLGGVTPSSITGVITGVSPQGMQIDTYGAIYSNPGTYTIRFTTEIEGCTIVREHDVTIAPSTTNAEISGPEYACAGDDFTLVGSGGDGSTQYEWYLDGNLVNGQTITESFATAGTYHIKLKMITSDGCLYQKYHTIEVGNCDCSFTPVILNQSSSACEGGSAVFEAEEVSPTALYSWYFGEPGDASIYSAIGKGPYAVSFPNAGTYNIRLKVTDGGCTEQVDYDITINSTPAPNAVINMTQGADDLCENSPVSFFATNAGAGATYTWDFGPNASPSTATGLGTHSVTFSGSTSENVSLTVSQSGCDAIDVTTVTIAPQPVATINTTCNANGTGDPSDDTFTFTIIANAGQGSTYSISGQHTASGLSYGVINGPYGPFNISDGNLSININDTGNCSSVPVIVTVPSTCSSGCNISASPVNIACNNVPTDTNAGNDYITFDLNPTATGNGASYNVSVSSGTITPTSASYGSATTFTLQNGSAGAGNVNVTITDGSDGSCTAGPLTIVDPGSCSAPCNLGANITTVCSDAGSPNDPSDDTFTFTINTIGGNGTTYTITGDHSATGLSYGTNEGPFGPFNISDGDLNISINDTGTCGSISEVVTAPSAPCASTDNCESLNVSSSITVDDQSTGNTDDDTYTISITATTTDPTSRCFNIDNVTTGTNLGTSVPYGSKFNAGTYLHSTYPYIELLITSCEDRNCTYSLILTPNILPVELTDFRAIGNQCNVNLEWETASERDNNYFIVEHSFDGRDFTPVGLVDGNGTTSDVSNYTFIHENVRQNLNHYRLKQVDFDGAYEYSNVESVTTNCYEQERGITRIFPNPTKGEIKVMFFMERAQDVELNVFDMFGQSIQSQRINLNQGNNLFDIDVSDLKAGIYMINMKNPDWNSQTFKVIKLD